MRNNPRTGGLRGLHRPIGTFGIDDENFAIETL
jgi:hypothetical protein